MALNRALYQHDYNCALEYQRELETRKSALKESKNDPVNPYTNKPLIHESGNLKDFKRLLDQRKSDKTFADAIRIGVNPAIIQNAVRRMGEYWVLRQINYVFGLDRIANKRGYLGKILANNQY